MWIQAGQFAGAFWEQTPRHFQLAMQGIRKRLEGEAAARTAQAYEAGAFGGLAHHGQLKALTHYTHKDKVQTPRQMAAAIQAMGAKSNMKIRRVDMRGSAT